MPVAVCPHCHTELDLDAEDVGALVECPACNRTFTAAPPAAPLPPPPPPTPPPDPQTRVTPCPHCGGQVTVAVEDLGYALTCPLCVERFVPRSPDEPTELTDTPPWKRPREWVRPRSPRRLVDREPDSPQEQISYAKSECESPGTGLIVLGVLTVLSGVWGLVMTVTQFDAIGSPFLMLGYGGYSVLAGAFWVYAGAQMKEVKQYGVCLIGCVSLIIPGVSPCCMLGVIFGVMGVSKLNDRRVKLGFAANRPGYDPDVA